MLTLEEETDHKVIMYHLMFVLKHQLETCETWREERFQDFQLLLCDWKGALIDICPPDSGQPGGSSCLCVASRPRERASPHPRGFVADAAADSRRCNFLNVDVKVRTGADICSFYSQPIDSDLIRKGWLSQEHTQHIALPRIGLRRICGPSLRSQTRVCGVCRGPAGDAIPMQTPRKLCMGGGGE